MKWTLSICESHCCRPYFAMLMIKVLVFDVLLTIATIALVLVHRMHIIPARRRFRIVMGIMKRRHKRDIRTRAQHRLRSLFVCCSLNSEQLHLLAGCTDCINVNWVYLAQHDSAQLCPYFFLILRKISLWHVRAVELLDVCSTLHYECGKYGKSPSTFSSVTQNTEIETPLRLKHP